MKERIARFLAWARVLLAKSGSRGNVANDTFAPAVLSLPHTSALGAYVTPVLECTCPPVAQLPHVAGTFVVDMQLDKLGQVMGHVGPRLQLRPPAGGLEWEAVPEVVRAATGAEQLRAKVKVVNSRGRWGK